MLSRLPHVAASDAARAERRFTYDIALPADVIPHPVDGEAENFELLSVQSCIDSMLRGEWKANSACGESRVCARSMSSSHQLTLHLA